MICRGERYGRIYLVLFQCVPIVKIGNSHFKDNVDSFEKRVTNMAGNLVTILMWDCKYENKYILERAIHKKLSFYRIWKDKEFFQLYSHRGKNITYMVEYYREVFESWMIIYVHQIFLM
jgi:hypothetical protein